MSRPRIISDQVEQMLRDGRTSAEIIQSIPASTPASIRVLVHRARKNLRMDAPLPGSRPLSLPATIGAALQNESICRGGPRSSANELAVQLLAVIVKDNLFDAILGKVEP